VETAEQTIERLEAFSEALASGYHGKKIREYFIKRGISSNLAEGIYIALEKEHPPQEFMKLLRVSIRESLRSLNFDPSGNAESKADQKGFVLELLREMGGHRGVDYAAFVNTAISNGITYQFIDEVVRSLLADGQCYEPKIGIIRLIS